MVAFQSFFGWIQWMGYRGSTLEYQPQFPDPNPMDLSGVMKGSLYGQKQGTYII